MKIAITGKGGVGKTTIASLLANAWVKAGYKVLAIDADPVASLAGALGFPEPDKIIPLSEMSGLVEERTGAKPGTLGQMFKLNPTVDDLPDKIAHEHNGIKLIVMGGVKTGGGGCVCPSSALIKTLIRHIILERNERVVIDMEAGVEHLGRSTADAVNWMITVVEPGLRSIQAAHRIKTLAEQIGIKNVVAIGNKVRSPEDRNFISNYLDKIKLIGTIPFSDSISGLDRKETVKPNTQIEQETKSIMDSLEQKYI
ncbi:MAG TPA: AAA family ATPase [Planctomycetota bacterium]|nr:AAA family ATPase [Planctomycetota bacterium]